jgi:hypothetical protein
MKEAMLLALWLAMLGLIGAAEIETEPNSLQQLEELRRKADRIKENERILFLEFMRNRRPQADIDADVRAWSASARIGAVTKVYEGTDGCNAYYFYYHKITRTETIRSVNAYRVSLYC